MRYRIEFGNEAIAQLRGLPKELRRNIGFRLDQLQSDLAGDVKKLKGGDSEYRLRIGNHASFSLWKKTSSPSMLCATEKKFMSNSAATPPVTLESVQHESIELRDRLEQLEDLRDLREARARQAGKPGVPWAQVKEELGLD